MSRRFVPRPVLATLAILAIGCLSDTVHYSPEADDEAFAAIASTWSGAGVALSLCEDVTAPEDENTCQVQHVVRGGGRGKRHEERQGGVGCGGCPFATVAYVTGELTGLGLPAGTKVQGEITLGSFSDDPYELPYHVSLRCIDPDTPCSYDGTLEADGTLRLLIPSSPGEELVLGRTGASTCMP